MGDVFSWLNAALESAPAVALAAAFGWGLLSLVLSPCHLTSIPLVVAFVGSEGGSTTRGRALALSLLFTLGIVTSIAVLGAATAAAGRMLGDVGAWVNYVVAAVFLLSGLHLLDVIPIRWGGAPEWMPRFKGWRAALLLGLVFGAALGPCTFAFMAPVLAVTLNTATASPAWSAALLAAFAGGHGSMIVAAGTSTTFVRRILAWNGEARGAKIARVVTGILLLLGAFYLLYTAR